VSLHSCRIGQNWLSDWGLYALDDFLHKAPKANSINSEYIEVTYQMSLIHAVVELGFEPDLCNPELIVLPKDSAYPESPRCQAQW
jgi:hypothetical protein